MSWIRYLCELGLGATSPEYDALLPHYDTVTGQWKLIIEATMFVTGAVLPVWDGRKIDGNEPAGSYTRLAGCDATPTLAIAAGP